MRNNIGHGNIQIGKISNSRVQSSYNAPSLNTPSYVNYPPQELIYLNRRPMTSKIASQQYGLYQQIVNDGMRNLGPNLTD